MRFLAVAPLLLIAAPAHALCLKAYKASGGFEARRATSPDGSAGPPDVEISGLAHRWPADAPNLWVDAGAHPVWVRILDDNGRAIQSFKIVKPDRACIVYGSMYTTYRIVAGRKNAAAGCRCN